MKYKPRESETLEYKETLAEIDDAGETICGFANKSGGVLYFGVKNNGEVLGIGNITEKTIRDVSQSLFDNFEPRLYFSIEEENNTIKISVQKSAQPVYTFKGKPFVRVGVTTKKMSQEEYQRRLIYFKSTNKDISSNALPGVVMSDLSQEGINELRFLLKNSNRYSVDIDKLSDDQLLKDLLLTRDGGFTIASLVLLGKEGSLARELPYSEIRYGYKLNPEEIQNQDMEIFRGGYLTYYKKIWEKINSRNINVSITYNLRTVEKRAFDELTIREAVNNAIAHRDYLSSSSTLLLQYPYKLDIISPGGFPDGVNPGNIINETKPRNKLIADILFKCGMVEQFGNGVNLMYKNQLSLGKFPPNYSNSDDNKVELNLDGKIQDEEFARYVLAVSEGKGKELSDRELILLNDIRVGKKIFPNGLTDSLMDIGLIEKVGRGKYILSKRYYQDTNQRWEYTRKKGLSTEKNKELILEHIRNFGGGKKEDFINLFQDLSESQIGWLLDSLKESGQIKFDGPRRSRAGRWVLNKD